MVDLKLDIPQDFFEEELRFDYVVTTEKKQIWAVELDLANELLRICSNNNLRIFAFAGTELGAIRHKGFIPWDDDIDFAMPRKDYEELCRLAEDSFSYPYFFQTEYNDKGSLRGHAQLRNSLTTGIIRMNFERGYRFNQGIFIDIFPVDNIPDDLSVFRKQLRKIKHKYNLMHNIAKLNSRYCLSYKQSCIKKIIKLMLHYPVKILDDLINLEQIIYHQYENECSKYSENKTIMCGTLSFAPEESRFYWHKEDSEKITWMPFEFMLFPVAEGYDNKLVRAYGDYKVPIRDASVHSNVFFDVNIPYTEYLKKGKLE